MAAYLHDPRLQVGLLEGENGIVTYRQKAAVAPRVEGEAEVYAVASQRADAEG